MDKRKQKLMRAILNRDARILAAKDEEISEKERERFFRMTVTGGIRKSDVEKVIEGIKGPDVAKAFEALKEDKFKKRILAYMSGLGFDNFEMVKEETINTFLERYPDPDSFEAAKNDFLEAIRRSNSEKKYEEYKQAMQEFEHDVYGKKQEYSELEKELVRDAEEWQLDQEAEGLRREFLMSATVQGDSWMQEGKEYHLTNELLEKVGLGPRFLLEIGGVKIALSRVFMVDVHEAAVAYVNYNGEVKVRGYYRSNSQGMWRYLADYVGGNGEISWYGVGFNEESLNLPFKVQKLLNEIATRGIYDIPGVNTGFFLGGTAKRFASKEEYKAAVADEKMDGDYYREVMRQPRLDFGTLSSLKHPPESIDVEGGAAPNFRKQLDHYQMVTKMYGEVMVRQFPSMDDEVRWTVIDRGEGNLVRAWIAGIEVNSTVTSTGLKSEWVSTGDICTPLFEYQSMTGGYGEAIKEESEGAEMAKREGYEDMWEKYLKLMPVVRKYLYTWRNG